MLALARLCEQQRAAYSQMKLVSSASQRERCRAIWRHMSSKGSESLFRMFFEAYSMGLQEPKRFASFLHTAVEDWLEYLAAPRMAQGEPRAAAREFATVILAGFRGFMLDYCVSRDRERVDAAVDLWLDALDAIPHGAGH